MKTLFKTVVGSHAWNMQRPESDVDTFETYIVPTKRILSGDIYEDGKNILYSTFTKDGLKDKNKHEIGSVIEELLDGNFNYIVGVCSPIVEEDKYGYLEELKDIVVNNLSKNIYNSTMGLAIHNYKKFILNNESRTVEHSNINGIAKAKEIPKKILSKAELQKKMNLIVRSLMFGKWILSHNKIYFTQIRDQDENDIKRWMTELEYSYNKSKLPERPDPTKFRNFLYKLRIDELNGSLDTKIWV